ncbi:villin [Cavenderia fasciculata]|uniref:Villin n=1 Tax=Cavenderia fasciculata TaxID=261658 RepID=F4PH66_CACFS|nr:villin [Cavenderia fasciculata]EGG25050.1 villin [Cavenderia fasciculata]|eukprot:XP_004362901.1 villin [Cavenderia fasciculata]
MGNTNSVTTGGGVGGTQDAAASLTFSPTADTIEISDRFLVAFPEGLKQLKLLKILCLSRNKIAKLDGISAMELLEDLDISYNSLIVLSGNYQSKYKYNINYELFQVKKLVKLNVSFNQINQFPSTVHQLAFLTTLNLSNNQIPSMHTFIGLAKSLNILNLSFNKTLPGDIGKLDRLTLLDLAENELQSLPNQLGQCKALTKLYLDNNDFLELINEVGQLEQLRELNLRSNQLVDLPSSMQRLKRLSILDLEDNQWENENYQSDDIAKLLQFLSSKRDVVNKARKSTSKEYRRTITRQKIEEKKRASVSSLFEPVFHMVAFKNTLYRVKGKNMIICRKMTLDVKNVAQDDVFLLVCERRIFVYIGAQSSLRERLKGLHLAHQLAQLDEQYKNNEVVSIELGKSRREDITEFWKEIGCASGKQPTNIPRSIEDDESAEEMAILNTKMFRFSEGDGGRIDIQVFAGEILYKSMLDSSSCAILDSGTDIFVWSGIYSSSNEKSWSMLKAEELMGRNNRHDQYELHWVLDGMESIMFKEMFVDWADASWDPEYKLALQKQQEIDEQQRAEAEREKRRMEMEELEEEERQYKLQKQQSVVSVQQPQQTQQVANVTPVSTSVISSAPNSAISTPSGTTPSSPVIDTRSERDKAKEREKEKIREKLKQRESSSGKLPIPSTSTSSTVTLPTIPKQNDNQQLPPSSFSTILLPPIGKPAATTTTPATVVVQPTQQPSVQQYTLPSLPTIPKTTTTTTTQPPSIVTLPSIPKPTPVTPTVTTTLPSIPKTVPVVPPTQPTTTTTTVKPAAVTTTTTTPVVTPVQPTTVKPAATTTVTKELPKIVQPVSVSISNQTPTSQNITPISTTPTIVSVPSTPSIIPEQSTSSGLIAPLPEKADTSRARKAPTKNPIRARQERAALEEEAAKARQQEQEKANAASGSTIQAQSKTNKATAQVGGFGLLYSLGADEAIFRQRKEKSEQQQPAPLSVNLQPKDQPKLLHIKGRRSPFVRQVELTYLSLNSGDVFILDCGKELNLIYQWNGKDANRIEKGKGMDIAKSIKDKERVGCRVVIVDDGKETDDFWKVLGGRGEIASADSAGDDREAELGIRKHINLYRVVMDENAPATAENLGIDLVPMDGRLTKNMLEGNECYILDCVSEMFVWTGSASKLKVRNASLKLGSNMLESRRSSIWVAHCHREFPGSEQVLFKERFPDWGGSLPISVQQAPVGVNTASRKQQDKIDVSKMLAGKAEKEEVMIDDGRSPRLQIWRVEDFTKVAIDPSQHGQFYSGDSYLILYTYTYKNKDNFLIYFWQGKNSSINEKGTSALLTMELDDTLKGMAKEIRVVQNKEPRHFLSIFNGRLVVHVGKDPLSKNYKRGSVGALNNNAADYQLYHIRGTTDWNTRAIQTKTSPHSLNSYNTFILTSADRSTVYVWNGRLSSANEKTFAKNIVKTLQINPQMKLVEIAEGKEPKEFWTAIGGSATDSSQNVHIWPATMQTRTEARLYSCSIGSGVFVVEEVNSFAQDDLLTEDVYIVDGVDHVWVWIGHETTEMERKMSMEVSVEYAEARSKQLGLSAPLPSYITYSGKEPYIFTSIFHGWDFAKRKEKLSYDQDIVRTDAILQLYTKKYTYDELINRQFPKGIDTSRLEDYMEEDEFIRIFQMSPDTFKKLPLWIKQSKKKELQLY